MISSTPLLPLKPMTQERSLDTQDYFDGLRLSLWSDGTRVAEVPALDVAIHAGRPLKMDCKYGVKSRSGLAIHGDIDTIPDGAPSRWEMNDTALILGLGSHALAR